MSPADAPAGRLLAAERENVLVVFDIVVEDFQQCRLMEVTRMLRLDHGKVVNTARIGGNQRLFAV